MKTQEAEQALDTSSAGGDDLNEDHCIICFQSVIDKTVLLCSHDAFCFECMVIWTKQSRRCPLCVADIGQYIIHSIRSKFDYQKHHLAPLRISSPPSTIRRARGFDTTETRRHRQAEVFWGRSSSTRRVLDTTRDELERAVERRRHIYHNRLFAKHIASNVFTKFKPYPTPSQIASSDDLQSRATAFVRRELRVWPNLDVEFLTQFVISLLRRVDIRSEPMVRALSEFLDLGGASYVPGASVSNAEHFAHELYSYLRSPFKELSVYDRYVKYDESLPLPSEGFHQGSNAFVHSLPSQPFTCPSSSLSPPPNQTRDSPRRDLVSPLVQFNDHQSPHCVPEPVDKSPGPMESGCGPPSRRSASGSVPSAFPGRRPSQNNSFNHSPLPAPTRSVSSSRMGQYRRSASPMRRRSGEFARARSNHRLPRPSHPQHGYEHGSERSRSGDHSIGYHNTGPGYHESSASSSTRQTHDRLQDSIPHIFAARTEADDTDAHQNHDSRKSNITLGGNEVGWDDHMVVPTSPGSQKGESAPQSGSPISAASACDLPTPPPGLLSIRNAATRGKEQSKLVISTAPRIVTASSLNHSQPFTIYLPSPECHINNQKHVHYNPLPQHPETLRHPSTEAMDFFRKRLLARLEETALSSATPLSPVTTRPNIPEASSASRFPSLNPGPGHRMTLTMHRGQLATSSGHLLGGSEHQCQGQAQIDSQSPVAEPRDEGNRFLVTPATSVEPTPTDDTVTARLLSAPVVNPSAVRERALKARLIRRRTAVNAAATEL